MKAVLQRVTGAKVIVDNSEVASCEDGLLIFLGVLKGDSIEDVEKLASKCCELRIFSDENGKMNCSILETGGRMLVVSQFTLAADCLRGRRPSFDPAAPPDEARSLYEKFCSRCRDRGVDVRQGQFAAHMKVFLTNDGPVTIILDTREGSDASNSEQKGRP